MKKTIHPTRSKFNILRPVCNLIPPHLVSKIARVTGAEDNLQNLLPNSVIIVTAHEHDSQRARELCAGSRPVKSC
jgi:hypothetical protein